MVTAELSYKAKTDAIIEELHNQYDPDHIYVLHSGGYDSDTTAAVAARHPKLNIDGIVHIDTGVGIPKTRDYVKQRCLDFNLPYHVITDEISARKRAQGKEKPLRQRITDDGEDRFADLEQHYHGLRRENEQYETLITKYGFPGRAAHRWMYINLKEKPLQRFVSQHDGTIVFISGVRTDESQQRMENIDNEGIQENIGAVWISPLMGWTDTDVDEYREENECRDNPVVDIMHMSGECLCLSPDTFVSTPDGWEQIQDIDEGDTVLSLQNGETKPTEVVEKHVQDQSDMVEIDPYYQPSITVTPNHPIYAKPYEFVYDDNYEYTQSIGEATWVDGQEIVTKTRESKSTRMIDKQRFYLGRPFRTSEQPVDLTNDQLRLLGYFVADGTYQWRPSRDDQSHGIMFTLSRESQTLAENIQEAFDDCFPNLSMQIEEVEDPRNGREYLYLRNGYSKVSKFIGSWINGRYSDEMELGSDLMTASIEQQKVLLNAMWEGDGSNYSRDRDHQINPEHVTAYGTTSKKLALQVQELLLRQNKVFGINQSGNDSYLVRQTEGETRYGFIEDNILWCLVKTVNEGHENERHNLTVRDEPNYLSEAGLVHNCGAFADREELEMLRVFYPDVAKYIECLEQKVFEQIERGEVDEEYALWGHGALSQAEQQARTDEAQTSLCTDCEERCTREPYDDEGSSLSFVEAAFKQGYRTDETTQYYCPDCNVVVDDLKAHRETVHGFGSDSPWDCRQITTLESNRRDAIITETTPKRTGTHCTVSHDWTETQQGVLHCLECGAYNLSGGEMSMEELEEKPPTPDFSDSPGDTESESRVNETLDTSR